MSQLKELNGANNAFYSDRYGPNSGFHVNPADGQNLADYYRHKADAEASVAQNMDDNQSTFLCVVVGIPLAWVINYLFILGS